MNRISSTVCLILVAILSLVVGLSLAQGPTPHWEYEGEEAGPAQWGELDPTYHLCGQGRAQSPIDLSGATALDLQDIQFNYSDSALNIFNNGHTIQVTYDPGSSLTYNEIRYELRQFHFHHPSEHHLKGQAAPMEIHLVHQDDTGNLAVVGVLLQVGPEDNPAYAEIFANLPAEKGDPQASALRVAALDLLPASRMYYTYIGSLTTPPCTQGVRWLVMREPVLLSEAQLEAFAALFELNARPLQTLNERDLLLDSQ
jgi:carbonic anhydrase